MNCNSFQQRKSKPPSLSSPPEYILCVKHGLKNMHSWFKSPVSLSIKVSFSWKENWQLFLMQRGETIQRSKLLWNKFSPNLKTRLSLSWPKHENRFSETGTRERKIGPVCKSVLYERETSRCSWAYTCHSWILFSSLLAKRTCQF